MTTPDLRRIRWRDPCSPEATTVVNIKDLSGVHGPMIIETLGWVLRDDDVGISVANEDVGGGHYRGMTFIDKTLVVSNEPMVPIRARVKKQKASSTKEEASEGVKGEGSS